MKSLAVDQLKRGIGHANSLLDDMRKKRDSMDASDAQIELAMEILTLVKRRNAWADELDKLQYI